MKKLYWIFISFIFTLLIVLSGCVSNVMPMNNIDIFPKARVATGKCVFIFDPNDHAWAIYDETGNLVKVGPASGGKDYCPDLKQPCRTIVGTFTAYRESGPECVSNEFPVGKGGAPMPDCIFFYKGYAIHGASVVPDYNTSHGCIHVTVSDAQWIESQIKPGDTIIVLPYANGDDN